MIKYKPPFNEDDTIYEITVADVLEVAENLGLPKEKVTDAAIKAVQDRLDSAFENWSVIVEDALGDSFVYVSQN